MRVELNDLTKRWGNVTGADNISLDIQNGEFVAFLGPSGCGKTTTLLMVAGIYKPSAGEIRFDDRVVNQIAPKDRNIGMVFQSYALYPHMSVRQNIGYPLKLKKTPTAETEQRVQRVADMMGIGQLLDRRPAQLSGGQQQRVALGRALVKEPSLLLFDEPLSNLDARLRMTMRSEIKRLQLDLGITSIYVTHDQVEAMTMADRIAVMQEGKLQAYAPPNELYERPRTVFIAGFVGNPPMNLFDAQVVQEGERYLARRQGFELELPPERGSRAAESGRVVVGIRPDDISLAQNGGDADASIAGEVFVVEPLGRDNLVDVRIEDLHLFVLADPNQPLQIGDPVRLQFDGGKMQLFDPETGYSLLWT